MLRIRVIPSALRTTAPIRTLQRLASQLVCSQDHSGIVFSRHTLPRVECTSAAGPGKEEVSIYANAPFLHWHLTASRCHAPGLDRHPWMDGGSAQNASVKWIIALGRILVQVCDLSLVRPSRGIMSSPHGLESCTSNIKLTELWDCAHERCEECTDIQQPRPQASHRLTRNSRRVHTRPVTFDFWWRCCQCSREVNYNVWGDGCPDCSHTRCTYCDNI